jgi:hypothetical protein
MNTDQKKLPKSPELPKLKNLLTTVNADCRGSKNKYGYIFLIAVSAFIRANPR